MTNQNEAQIIARIEELKGDLMLHMKQICDLLVLVRQHYLHRDPLFRWYREVAQGKLAPAVGLAMARRTKHVPHMMGRPMDVQLRVVAGAGLDWCEEQRGQIVRKHTSWDKMPLTAFRRMFPVGGPVRSITEQEAVLRSEMEAKTRPTVYGMSQPEAPAYVRGHAMPRLDLMHNKFMLGREVIPLTVLVSVMQANGMTVSLSQTAGELWIEGYDRARDTAHTQDEAVH